MQLAYLYSRYPVVSQTFCDLEMLELERRGYDLLIASVHAPLTSLRHEHFARFRSPVFYAPPSPVLRLWEKKTREAGLWPEALIDRHDRRYGPTFKAELRARNATWFAELFAQHGITHFHVHFANRAAHTAIFVKEISGIPFSVTAHGQDFMSDLGHDELLREICMAAEFVAAETDYSRELLQKRCPEAAHKIHRVYNGLDLTHLGPSAQGDRPPGPVTILSTGRLVPFKGFEVLLEACGELDRRNFDFRCEIVGDGPLREKLEGMIAELHLQKRVELCGSLSQREVFSRLRACDIFALASVVDAGGASDVFPTVIMEAMACGKPVVSSKLAGIPELVIDGLTGLLVPPEDWEEFAQALDKLVRDPLLRRRMGDAGRHRMETDFSVIKTVEPLHQLFTAALEAKPPAPSAVTSTEKQAAYLIDRWPDDDLPFLEMELCALQRNGVRHVPFLFHPPAEFDRNEKRNELLSTFVFLPDAMVIEAEWQSNRPLMRELEAIWASQTPRPSSEIFLAQARAAVILRRLFQPHNIGHVHATSSRVLLCALYLKRLLGVTVSVALEPKPMFSEALIRAALDQCAGARIADRELLARRGSGFVFDETLDKPSVNDIGPWLTRKARIEWTGGRSFFREWGEQLAGWTRA